MYVFASSTIGKRLVNQRTISMQEINVHVNSINEIISVIDQIAFQTNKLSLNAAEEVRNLASRSSETARVER